jgi:large subunit ribosomal protein L1
MPKHSKRFNEINSKVDATKRYEPAEAMTLVKELATAKFDETVEVHLRMGVDPRHADQQVRGVVTLPNGTGREVRILAFVGPDGQAIAEEAGADYVGADELADRVQKGWTDFDIVVATPDMMRVVGKLGRVLGPRGLMPSPKTGTIVPAEDLPRVIQEARMGRIEFRVDKTSNIHVPIGKASFEANALAENFSTFMDAIMAAKPANLKSNYIHRITVTSTMGPGLKIDLATATGVGTPTS